MFDHDSSTDPYRTIGRRSGRRPRRILGAAVVSAAALVGALGAAPVVSAAATEGPVDRVAERPTTITAMTLSCAALDRDTAAIGCRWSIPEGAAGYRLIRVALGSGMGRMTVHRTDDPAANSYVDSAVRRGVRYLYAVRAVDASGHLVGASRPVVAGVPEIDEPPTVDVLRLACEASGATTARCGWSLPDDRARVLTLWRSVDGGARERVASFSAPFPTSYGDQVPASSSSAIYAVIATDGAGEIVARSRPNGVVFPDREPPIVDTRPLDTRPVDTRPVDTRPVDTRPVDTRPVDTRPVDTRPVDTRPVDTRRVDTRPVDTRPVDTRPVDTRPVDTRPAVPSDVRPDRAPTRGGDRTS